MKTYTLQEANDKLYGSDTRVVYEYDARGVVMRLEELVGWELGCGDKWKTCSNLQTLICESECGTGGKHYEPAHVAGEASNPPDHPGID
jgi:hypothetical protein